MKYYNPYIKKIYRMKYNFSVKSAEILYKIMKLSRNIRGKIGIEGKRYRLDCLYNVFSRKETIKNIKDLDKKQKLEVEDFIIEELVTIDKINDLEKGLRKIFRKYKHSSSNLSENINGFGDFFYNTKTRYYCGQWINVGSIIFPEDHVLSKYIEYIEISLENFTSSIIRVNLYIRLKIKYNEEIKEIITRSYHDVNELHINKGFKNSFFELLDGASVNGDIYKQKEIQNRFIYLKWLVLKEFARDIPLYFYSKNIPSPSIEFFSGTGIFGTEEDGVSEYIMNIGIDKNMGRKYGYSKDCKYEIYTESFYTNFNSNSVKFIYDEEKVNSIFQFGFLGQKKEIGRQILKHMIIESMCENIYNILGNQKTILVRNTIGKSKYKYLFNIRYEIEKSRAILKSLERDIDPIELEISKEEINDCLELDKRMSVIIEIFSRSKWILDELKQDIDSNIKLLDDTISLLSIKSNRKAQNITIALTVITVIFTAITIWISIRTANNQSIL